MKKYEINFTVNLVHNMTQSMNLISLLSFGPKFVTEIVKLILYID